MSAIDQFPTPQDRFHENMIGLGELIYELISESSRRGYHSVEPRFVKIAVDYAASKDKIEAIENFINGSKDVWDQIIAREETFFAKNAAKLFPDLPPNMVTPVASLLTGKQTDGADIVSQEDKEAIWAFLDSLIKICIKYIHIKRVPIIKQTENGPKPYYQLKYQPTIPIQKYANHYKIKLEFHPESTTV